MQFFFNPSMDVHQVASVYAKDKRCRINNVFSASQLGALKQALQQDTDFTNAYFLDGENKTISNTHLRELTPSERQTFFKSLYQEAAKGVGFFYGRHHILDAEQNSVLKGVFDWLNSQDTLQQVSDITGIAALTSASAQATRYVPGHFLTRHSDKNTSEDRRIAYVISVADNWHPDWGGLLQFFQADGTPKDAWSPATNTMALFDVEHIHSVTSVAPFAPVPRLSITGWFKGK